MLYGAVLNIYIYVCVCVCVGGGGGGGGGGCVFLACLFSLDGFENSCISFYYHR